MHKFKGFLPFILTGLLLGLSFPPIPLPFVAFIAFLPLLLGFESMDENGKYVLKTYIAFLIYHGMSNWWISSWQENTDRYLFVSGFAVWLANSAFFLIPVIIYKSFRKRFSFELSLLSFPFIWTFFEWGHGLGQLSYPWLNIGYSQINFSSWIQQLDFWGIYGASFSIASINALLVYNVKRGIIDKDITLKYLFPSLFALVLLFLLPCLYGSDSIDKFDSYTSNNNLNVSLIQPNKDPWEKWKSAPKLQVMQHMRIQDSLKKVNGESDLSLWSETAIPFITMDFNSRSNFSFLQRWLDTNDLHLITGMARYELFVADSAPPMATKAKWDNTIAFQAYNAAVLISPLGLKNPQIYNKAKLTPFAERIPYAEYIPFATDFMNWGVGISSWGLGKEMRTLNMHKNGYDFKIGTIICIESIYPEFCTEFVNAGANVLTIITNDAWYNHTPGPYQHYVMARARAIENRRYITRCANSGISGLISPTGESIAEIPQYVQAGMNVKVPALEEISFYTKNGDFIGKISAIFVLLFFVYSRFSKPSKSEEIK